MIASPKTWKRTPLAQDVTVTKTVERRKLPQGEKPIRVRANSNGQPIYILHATDDEILNKQNALISKAVRTLGSVLFRATS